MESHMLIPCRTCGGEGAIYTERRRMYAEPVEESRRCETCKGGGSEEIDVTTVTVDDDEFFRGAGFPNVHTHEPGAPDAEA